MNIDAASFIYGSICSTCLTILFETIKHLYLMRKMKKEARKKYYEQMIKFGFTPESLAEHDRCMDAIAASRRVRA